MSPCYMYKAYRYVVCVQSAMNRLGRCWNGAWLVLGRTKPIDINKLEQTELRRCLSVVDLIALGKRVLYYYLGYNYCYSMQ